jgi:tRNA(Ile)-lysidine synthase TilS/MesJ
MGLDSVAAISFMKNRGYKLIPIHFNHALRDQNFRMMEKFLDFCTDMNLSGHVGMGRNLTTESDCRNARLDFYNKMAGGGIVITAHHLNDWVESYLLNCFRGHPHHNPFELVSNFGSFSIIHPFLLSKKKDFIEYAERNDLIKYVVEDETNNIVKGSRRNWIRNNLVPEMKNHKLSLEKFAQRQILKLTSNLNQLV